jgi:hypothetical protein
MQCPATDWDIRPHIVNGSACSWRQGYPSMTAGVDAHPGDAEAVRRPLILPTPQGAASRILEATVGPQRSRLSRFATFLTA